MSEHDNLQDADGKKEVESTEATPIQEPTSKVEENTETTRGRRY